MEAKQFSVGVNYWPRRRATALWHDFDAGEIRADFAHIAALGLDTVRFFVRADAFMPQAGHVETVMLERLETIVTLAGEAGLRALPALFCGHLSGVNYLPEWALDRRRPRGRFRTFCGEREMPMGCADPFSGALLDAQLVLARAAGERLRGHPALFAWDIGHAVSNLREPSHAKLNSGEHSQEPADERVVAQWSKRLTQTLRDASAVAVTAGTHSGDLLADRDVRLGTLCAPLTFASMQGDSVNGGFVRSRLDPEVLPFLAMLTAGFSYKPVFVTAFGNPTCAAGKFSAFERFALPGEPPNLTISPDDPVFAPYPCLTEDENAIWCTATLERLHADGRLGALWWTWADYSESFADRPPFDLAPQERTCGIVRSDGTPKPVAAALAAFAAQRRTVVRAADMPMIASAYYYRTLPTSTRTLFDAFLRFVEERRTVA